MKLTAAPASPLALKVLITANFTGVKVDLDLKPSHHGVVFEIDKFNSLEDSNASCLYLADRQRKLGFVPEGFDGARVLELLEWESRILRYAPAAPEAVEKVAALLAQTEGKTLVGAGLTLADIAVFVWLYGSKAGAGNTAVEQWMARMLGEKHVQTALSAMGVQDGLDLTQTH